MQRAFPTDELVVLTEPRRRTVLAAMQVDCWLPRTSLPFAAPPRAYMLKATQRAPVAKNSKRAQAVATVPTVRRESAGKVRAQLAVPAKPAKKLPSAKAKSLSTPHFSLQLLRAGDCLLLLDCPYGEFLQSREPAYLLLLDIVRAAQLPPSRPVGEPVSWPLLASNKVAQDDEAALDYVQSFVRTQQEAQPCACLWLLGADALRFAAGGETAIFHELYIDGLCNAWALPALDELLAQQALKRELWQSMQRVMQRWKTDD